MDRAYFVSISVKISIENAVRSQRKDSELRAITAALQ